MNALMNLNGVESGKQNPAEPGFFIVVGKKYRGFAVSPSMHYLHSISEIFIVHDATTTNLLQRKPILREQA